jgi:hypoxanthine phosphoribosyltransferase
MSKNIITISWDDIDNIIERMVDDITGSEVNIDCILGLSRGGLIPAVMLANKLNISKVYSYGLRSYDDNDAGDIKTYQYIGSDGMGIEKDVLIVDDISDRGATLGFVKSRICMDSSRNYVHKNIHTCTLCIKKGTDFLPTWYDRSYDNDDWIIFPWEVV